MGQHHVSQACVCFCSYRCGCLSVHGPVGALVVGLNDFGFFFCTFASEKTVRRGGSYPYVLSTVGKRHHRQFGQVQGLDSRWR